MEGAAARSTERAARGAATRPAAAWNIMDCAANSISFCVGDGGISGVAPFSALQEHFRISLYLELAPDFELSCTFLSATGRRLNALGLERMCRHSTAQDQGRERCLFD